jgi:very-short-patch-repair endonuclease
MGEGEVDGGQHSIAGIPKETNGLTSRDINKALRFWNNELLTNIEGVLEVIRRPFTLFRVTLP